MNNIVLVEKILQGRGLIRISYIFALARVQKAVRPGHLRRQRQGTGREGSGGQGDMLRAGAPAHRAPGQGERCCRRRRRRVDPDDNDVPNNCVVRLSIVLGVRSMPKEKRTAGTALRQINGLVKKYKDGQSEGTKKDRVGPKPVPQIFHRRLTLLASLGR